VCVCSVHKRYNLFIFSCFRDRECFAVAGGNSPLHVANGFLGCVPHSKVMKAALAIVATRHHVSAPQCTGPGYGCFA